MRFKQRAFIEFLNTEKIPLTDVHRRLQAVYWDKCDSLTFTTTCAVNAYVCSNAHTVNCSSLASVPNQSAIFSVRHFKSSVLGRRHVHFLSRTVSNATAEYGVDSRGSNLSRIFQKFPLNNHKTLCFVWRQRRNLYGGGNRIKPRAKNRTYIKMQCKGEVNPSADQSPCYEEAEEVGNASTHSLF